MRLTLRLKMIAAGIMLFCSATSFNDTTRSPLVNNSLSAPAEQFNIASKYDTINKPELVRSGKDRSLRLTAENGRPIGPKIKYMPEWRAFGWFTSDDRIEWDVKVSKSGIYEASLEWSVTDKEAGKEFLLEVKDNKLTGEIASSGSWETFKTAKIGSIRLKAGRQKMVFRPNQQFETGGILDFREIRLTLVSNM